MASAKGGASQVSPQKHTNRLIKEESPYLLQHAHNPVDWYPWGDAAFEVARRENKPIFLSVGYSTCHWCHVMERESFESEEVAKLMNSGFVNIKVDREERPDVDKVYMAYVQATQGGGGWPMSCFLTPELQPFLGGTYFPPKDMMGRPGFSTVLKRVAAVWGESQDQIRAQASDVMRQLTEFTTAEASNESLEDSEAVKSIEVCARALEDRYDEVFGGFGEAPKFPRPAELNLLLTQHLRAKAAGDASFAEECLRMAVVSLKKMAAGGMWDHVGGGFHRYSVDERWHVPHFEKMLYDNPQLAQTYLNAFALTGDLELAWVARGILDYLRRDLGRQGGGFYSAEDADSMDKKGTKAEGAFYVWEEAEIDEVLSTESAQWFKRHYGVKAAGNCTRSPRSDPMKEFKGKNVLFAAESVAETASAAGMSEESMEKLLSECREALHVKRAQRPRPHLDDKVVVSWNGMAIGAFALASRVLPAEAPPLRERQFPVEGVDPKDYLAVAIEAAEFVRSTLWDASSRRLRRSFCRGPSAVEGFADDYANLVSGLLDLFGATGDVSWMEWALQVQGAQDELFWDEAAGGYFGSMSGDASLLLRMKEDYDGAEPAASSIAAANLHLLAATAAQPLASQFSERARRTASAFRGRLISVPLAMPQMCCALHLQTIGHLRQVVVVGDPANQATQTLLDVVYSTFTPDKIVIPLDPSHAPSVSFWQSHNPAVLQLASGADKGGAPAVFICQNFSCKAPTSDPAKVRSLLLEVSGGLPKKPSASGLTTPIDLSKISFKKG